MSLTIFQLEEKDVQDLFTASPSDMVAVEAIACRALEIHDGLDKHNRMYVTHFAPRSPLKLE